MTVSTLSLLLGVGMIGSHGWALLNAASAAKWVRAFHRNHAAGVVLMMLGALWLEWNVYNEDLSDIETMKPALLVAFPALGIGACVFVRDFLAVRGLAAFMLMLSWFVLDRVRWHPSLWRDALSAWAYVWVCGAFWITLSPWKLRDWAAWITANPARFRLAAVAGLVWGAFVVALSMTAFA